MEESTGPGIRYPTVHAVSAKATTAPTRPINGALMTPAITITSLQQMDPRNPRSAQIVQGIVNSPNPGESLMALHGNDEVASLGVGRHVEPPFARTRETRGPVRVDRVHRDEDAYDSGYGHQQVEEDIFTSALKDKPSRGYVNRGRGWEQE
jgi:hypothetical protein